jgi:hypothetical protein
MVDDRLTAGAISGIIASTVKTSFNILLNTIGIAHLTYPSLITIFFLHSLSLQSVFSLVLGFIVDLFIGGCFGILFIYFLKWFTRRYLWFKALFLSNLLWLFGPVILLSWFKIDLNYNFYYISLLDHWVFGLITIYMIQKLYPVPS